MSGKKKTTQKIASLEDILNVTDAAIAFGADIRVKIPYDLIPEEFKADDHKFQRLAGQLFYIGGNGVELHAKDEVTKETLGKVMRAYRAYGCSYEPRHEEKMAGLAYMFSLVFDDWRLNKEKPNA